jgi:catechol 2,3-dioxygenase
MGAIVMSLQDIRFDHRSAPLRIGGVRLRVRDLGRVSDFYTEVLGLSTHRDDGRSALLGSPEAPLLELIGDPGVPGRDPGGAGLFHTAFLMPTRGDLARWLAHVLRTRTPLQGMSDHIVSEAIYLADPEGNGIEVYADRPPPQWRGADGEIVMTTERLDARNLLASAGDAPWTGFPAGGIIGHVHLQVGDTGEADRFYSDLLGFDIASRYDGASFYGSGGYHHQLAGNVWNSRGAGRRQDGAAGLETVRIVVRDAEVRDGILARAGLTGDNVVVCDPWGTRIEITADAPRESP